MKLRSVNTKFWDDSFIIECNSNEKLLFLYLLTNPLTSTLGIYEITIKRISFDTGLNDKTILKALERFQKLGKVFYNADKNLIILPNFIKNQSMNSNMEKGAINSYNELPNSIKPEGYANTIESFETLLKALKAFGNINLNKDKPKDKDEDKQNSLTWKNDFDIYFSQCKENFDKYQNDESFILQQENLNPNIDIKKTLEKAFVNFWGTEAGWQHKKKSKTEEIDWRRTIINAIDLNKVYRQNGNSNGKQKIGLTEALKNW